MRNSVSAVFSADAPPERRAGDNRPQLPVYDDEPKHGRNLSIAEKVVPTMINYKGVGDLYRMCLVTQEFGASDNEAYIDGFHAQYREDFDPDYMRALYHYAYEIAEKGCPWRHLPPGVRPPTPPLRRRRRGREPIPLAAGARA